MTRILDTFIVGTNLAVVSAPPAIVGWALVTALPWFALSPAHGVLALLA